MTNLNRRQLLTAAGLGAARPAPRGGRRAPPAAAPAPGAATGPTAHAQPAIPGGPSRPAPRALPRPRLVDARRAEGRRHHQPDRHPHQPAHHRRRDARGRAPSTSSAVFGPEHGFRGTAQAGGSEGTHTDPRTGLTVYDAYGANAAKMRAAVPRRPGSRPSSSTSRTSARASTPTSGRCTRRCARPSRPARGSSCSTGPNPIGGTARGPMMTTPYTSGVGAKEIVQAHGMTVGELARLLRRRVPAGRRRRSPGELSVVEVKRLAPRHAVCRHRAARGSCRAPTCRRPTPRCVYPGTGMFEGDQPLRGARHDPAVRADRRAVRRLPVGGTACSAGTSRASGSARPTSRRPSASTSTRSAAASQVHVTDPRPSTRSRAGVEMLVAAKAALPRLRLAVDDDPRRTGSTS